MDSHEVTVFWNIAQSRLGRTLLVQMSDRSRSINILVLHQEALKAIDTMNNKTIKGRPLVVSFALNVKSALLFI